MFIKMNHSLILAKCKAGQKKDGVQYGTKLHTLFPNNIIKDFLNNTIETELFNSIDGYKMLYEIHQKHFQNNLIPITLGGDHSIGHITVGSSIQKYKDDILILWIDAHADANTYDASLSKNTHGMPVSGLLGLEKQWIPEITHLLKPSNIIYYGIRDLDEYEKTILQQYNIKKVSLDELNELVKKYDNVHISFDVDSLNKLYLDSTGTIADGGISPDEVIECFNLCKNKIKAFDIVEFNPNLGDLSKSIKTMIYIINNIL
jgi:arginase